MVVQILCDTFCYVKNQEFGNSSNDKYRHIVCTFN